MTATHTPATRRCWRSWQHIFGRPLQLTPHHITATYTATHNATQDCNLHCTHNATHDSNTHCNTWLQHTMQHMTATHTATHDCNIHCNTWLQHTHQRQGDIQDHDHTFLVGHCNTHCNTWLQHTLQHMTATRTPATRRYSRSWQNFFW